MKKPKQMITKSKSSKTKLSTIETRAAKISVLSLRNVGKDEFLTGGEVLPEKGLLQKNFKYSPIGCELKKTNWHCKRSI